MAESRRCFVWDSVLKSIVEPPKGKKVWYNGPRPSLDLVIIEPRAHPWLRGVLFNMAHVYGGGDAALHIFHGNTNAACVDAITDGWINVYKHSLGVGNLTIADYNALLTSAKFWNTESFHASHVLIFQTDTILLKHIPSHFFAYDYVGAPWPFHVDPSMNPSKNVGNGGLSLRCRERMRALTSLYEPTTTAEDVYLVTRISHTKLPTNAVAAEFSVEHIYNADPCGLHQAWRFHDIHKVRTWLSKVPGVLCNS